MTVGKLQKRLAQMTLGLLTDAIEIAFYIRLISHDSPRSLKSFRLNEVMFFTIASHIP